MQCTVGMNPTHRSQGMEQQDPEKRAMASIEQNYKPQDVRPTRGSSNPRRWFRFSVYAIIALLTMTMWADRVSWHKEHSGQSIFDHFRSGHLSKDKKPDQCPQVASLLPDFTTPALDEMDEGISAESFMNLSVHRLSSVVQIPTESFDDMGLLGEDKRWDIFFTFAEHLRSIFPMIHKELKLEMVNTHGLLYTWQGTDEDKKPLVLMSHQDVVPVPKATVDSWTHPPFSGHFDGKYVWGRGASDCKNQLIAVMETVELLLSADFKPKRTIILSFGFDEEISGREGAGSLAPFLLNRYGKDGIAAIVDEGAGFASLWGSTFAVPGVGEKGYTDVEITIRMPGGHSSIPPAHTSIGVLSELITNIESDTYRTWLADENPYLSALQCGASHAPSFPKKLKKLLPKHGKKHSSSLHSCLSKNKKPKPDKLALAAASQALSIRYLMETSIAVDVIEGGVKVNALPERSVATINHRINIGDTVDLITEKHTRLAAAIAKKYNLTLHAFPTNLTAPPPKSITLTLSKNTLAVAPVTPSAPSLSPYAILAGTTRSLYGTDIIVAPGIMTGNTDTRYYWDLSRHIFRWNPGWVYGEEGLGNIHTVDERQNVQAHINAVKWFSRFVRNMDEAVLE